MGQTSLATSGSIRPPKFPDAGPGSNTATTGQGMQQPGQLLSQPPDPNQLAQSTVLLSQQAQPDASGGPSGSPGRPQDFSIRRGGIYGLTKQERGATGFQQNYTRPYFLDKQGRKWISDGSTWQLESSPLAFTDQGVEGQDWVSRNRGVAMAQRAVRPVTANYGNRKFSGMRQDFYDEGIRMGMTPEQAKARSRDVFNYRNSIARQAEAAGAVPNMVEFLFGQEAVLLPGGIVGSFGNAGPTFEDLRGRPVQATPELLQANQAEHVRIYGAKYGPGTNRPTLNYGPANLTGLPPTPTYGVPGGASGLLAMPPGASPSGTGQQVVLAEAGEPEVAIPVSRLLAEIGPDQALKVIKAVSHTVVGGDHGTPGLAAGGIVDPDQFNPGRGVPGRQEYLRTHQGGRGPGGEGGSYPNIPSNTPPGAPASSPATFEPFQIYSFPDGGGGFSSFSGWSPASYQAYQPQAMPQDERAQLQAVTQIARLLGQQGQGLYNVGAPAYAQAIKYYQALLGGNRAALQSATASTQEAIRQQGKGTEDQIRGMLGRSGAADQAIADRARQEAGAIAEVTRGVQPAAAAALQSGGLQGVQLGQAGEQAGAGLHGAVQGAMAQNRQFETGLGESSRQFGAGLSESSRQFGTQLQEQSRQFAAGLAEQVRQGNMSYSQAMAGLALQGKMFDQEFGLKGRQFDEMVRQFDESLRFQQEQLRAQRSMARGQMFGQLGGAAIGGAALL